MARQTRSEIPSRFLDASLVPLENALKYRVDVLTDEIDDALATGSPADSLPIFFRQALAEQLQILAEELHHW